MGNAYLDRLPFALPRLGVHPRAVQGAAALVLAAVGTTITVLAVTRRAAAARLRAAQAPEPPVIVWEG